MVNLPHMVIESITERGGVLVDQLLVELLVLVILGLVGWIKKTWIKQHLPPLNTPERTMKRAKRMLDGWYTIEKNGEIVFRPLPEARLDSHLPHFRKAPLYIFAARDAYDMNRRETPIVTDQELGERGIYCDTDLLVDMGLGAEIEESAEAGCNKEAGEKKVSEGYELDRSIADDIAAYIKQLP